MTIDIGLLQSGSGLDIGPLQSSSGGGGGGGGAKVPFDGDTTGWMDDFAGGFNS
jgi:hypothetical protein